MLDRGGVDAALVWLKDNRYFLAAGIVGGTLLGGLVFAMSLLDKLGLFLVTGGLLGLLTTGAYVLFTGHVELREVQLGLPMYTRATFAMGYKDRDVAWSLFVEITSRITTQRLDPEQGILREALTSLYSMFTTTRILLKEKPPSSTSPSLLSRDKTVEELALAMLNLELRPFLTRWHPLLTQFEAGAEGVAERNWEHNETFRSELEELRQRLIMYAKAFGKLSGLSDVDHLITGSIGAD